jgi:hypothetical protein
MSGGDTEQRAECGMPGAAAVEAEDELVAVGLQVFAAQPVVDAQGPDFKMEKMRCARGRTIGAAMLPMTWGS